MVVLLVIFVGGGAFLYYPRGESVNASVAATLAVLNTDISAQRHDGEFAFLSACMTAMGGVNLPDEAITLAAALHYTGYRQVIGTLWSIFDRTAADVAEALYADLTATGSFNPNRAADALHSEIRRLRDAKRDAPLFWTPFTHTGTHQRTDHD